MPERPPHGAPTAAPHRFRLPGGLQTRLALTIAGLVVGVGAVAFLAIDRTTRAELEGGIDDGLEGQHAEFERQITAKDPGDPAELARAARSFIVSQRSDAQARIVLIEVGANRQVTSHPELIEHETEDHDESGDGDGGGEDDEGNGHDEREDRPALLSAPEGFSEVPTEDAGDLRVLTRPILSSGQRIGSFRVAEPLESVSESQEGLRNAFLGVGLAAIGLAIAAAALVANRITAPLRQMTAVATDVDAGDLSPRFEADTGDEVEQLAHSFNGMLDRLERAFNRERGFVSDASHELRTPLTVLRGQVELLERVGDDRAQRHDIAEALEREIVRMSRLVDEMLTLARADDGRLLDPRPIDLVDYLADLERDLPLLGDRAYRVDGARTGVLVADPDRLSQVFRNLVRNAVQHTRPGDRITISCDAHDDQIEFSVADNGPGIPPEELPNVFERFHRVDAGRSRDHGGSGLGLAIARAIVEAHGGRIWAESKPGAGATIRFILPGFRAMPETRGS